MLSALRLPWCCCAGHVCQPPPTPAPLPPNSLFCGSQGPEVATPGQACHPATQFQAWWLREGLLLSADTLLEVYVESHRSPSVPQLPDSVPVLLWPGLALPQTGDRAISEAGYFPRAALAVHLPGPTSSGVGRMAGTMQQELEDPSVRLLGKREPAPAIPAQCWGSRQLLVPQGCSLGQSRWSPLQATSHTLTQPPFKAGSFTALQRGTHIPLVSCPWAPSNQWAPSAQWTPCFRKPRNGC